MNPVAISAVSIVIPPRVFWNRNKCTHVFQKWKIRSRFTLRYTVHVYDIRTRVYEPNAFGGLSAFASIISSLRFVQRQKICVKVDSVNAIFMATFICFGHIKSRMNKMVYTHFDWHCIITSHHSTAIPGITPKIGWTHTWRFPGIFFNCLTLEDWTDMYLRNVGK